jgi:hypothetical protein
MRPAIFVSMARISFTSSTEEIIGKYGGNVFQDSYFGIQLRGLAKPRNPQTQLQQLRRGDFRFMSSSWRNLTSIQQATWISAAGTIPEALRLFIGSNINLILVGIPAITSYSPQTTPVTFPVQIDSLSPIAFEITASGATTTVPADNSLLIYATDDARQTDTYINPSQYTPIKTFVTGTDMTASHDLIINWFHQYGIMHLSRRICLKSVLINTISGQRGTESIICATVSAPVTNFLINFGGAYIIQSGGGYILHQ